jgi:hypothetical protein
MTNCGKLKKSGTSLGFDWPEELARRKKEFGLGYKLRGSKKVSETRMIKKGMKL